MVNMDGSASLSTLLKASVMLAMVVLSALASIYFLSSPPPSHQNHSTTTQSQSSYTNQTLIDMQSSVYYSETSAIVNQSSSTSSSLFNRSTSTYWPQTTNENFGVTVQGFSRYGTGYRMDVLNEGQSAANFFVSLGNGQMKPLQLYVAFSITSGVYLAFDCLQIAISEAGNNLNITGGPVLGGSPLYTVQQLLASSYSNGVATYSICKAWQLNNLGQLGFTFGVAPNGKNPIVISFQFTMIKGTAEFSNESSISLSIPDF